jgi:hypothetical protein
MSFCDSTRHYIKLTLTKFFVLQDMYNAFQSKFNLVEKYSSSRLAQKNKTHKKKLLIVFYLSKYIYL